jgi:hypothetical protein
MIITAQTHQIEFIQIHLILNKHNITNLFAEKNNKTLAETLLSRRYSSLYDEVTKQYSDSLDEPLGKFVYKLKQKDDKFYLRFLNSHGDKVFCDFSIPSNHLSKKKGLYCFVISNSIKYLGRSHDPFEKRLNQGYGRISPKNCYIDGQSTNCHINSLIAEYFDSISFYICPMADDLEIDEMEKNFLRLYKPEWNLIF